MFKKMDKSALPPRQWLLIGHPGVGKSTFSAQMKSPILAIDTDRRYAEVASLCPGTVYDLADSDDDGIDMTDASQMAAVLKKNLPGSDVKTIVFDSVTAFLTPKVVTAILDNDSGKNKNRVTGFKDKALSMRLLEDTITNAGVNVLWIAHRRATRDSQAREIEVDSISTVELARLRRCLNMELEIVTEGKKFGVKVRWARNGRSGMTLWDETGVWKGMPEKIEEAVYGGLTKEDMRRIENEIPKKFNSPEDAVAWGFEQGCFRDAVHSKNAYDKLKTDKKPKSAQDMWDAWLANIALRKAEKIEDADALAAEVKAKETAQAELPVAA